MVSLADRQVTSSPCWAADAGSLRGARPSPAPIAGRCVPAAIAMVSKVSCPTCRKVFKGSTLKSAKSARDRHIREKHKAPRAAAKAAAERKRRNAVGARLRRAREAHEECAPVAALVLCPLRRDAAVGYFEKTAEQLIGAGVLNAQRMQGYDLAKAPKAAQACTSQQVVMKAFEDIFMPRAQRMFDADPQLKFVLFVEDDMSFQQGIGKAELLAALGDARARAAAWLGRCLLSFNSPERFAQRSRALAQLARQDRERSAPKLR